MHTVKWPILLHNYKQHFARWSFLSPDQQEDQEGNIIYIFLLPKAMVYPVFWEAWATTKIRFYNRKDTNKESQIVFVRLYLLDYFWPISAVEESKNIWFHFEKKRMTEDMIEV